MIQVKQVLDLVEQKLHNSIFEQNEGPDRYTLMNWLSLALNDLASLGLLREFVIYSDALIATNSSERQYPLPRNFGRNFIEKNNKYLIKLSDGNSSARLDYEPFDEFFGADFVSETSSRPTKYTIATLPSGQRALVLKPKPDDEYTIAGGYLPDYTDVLDEDLTLPGEFLNFLTYHLLAQINPQGFTQMFAIARNQLLTRAAADGKFHLEPDERILEPWQTRW